MTHFCCLAEMCSKNFIDKTKHALTQCVLFSTYCRDSATFQSYRSAYSFVPVLLIQKHLVSQFTFPYQLDKCSSSPLSHGFFSPPFSVLSCQVRLQLLSLLAQATPPQSSLDFQSNGRTCWTFGISLPYPTVRLNTRIAKTYKDDRFPNPFLSALSYQRMPAIT